MVYVNIGIEKYAVLVTKRGKEFKSEIRNVVKARLIKANRIVNAECANKQKKQQIPSYMINVRSLKVNRKDVMHGCIEDASIGTMFVESITLEFWINGTSISRKV